MQRKAFEHATENADNAPQQQAEHDDNSIAHTTEAKCFIICHELPTGKRFAFGYAWLRVVDVGPCVFGVVQMSTCMVQCWCLA